MIKFVSATLALLLFSTASFAATSPSTKITINGKTWATISTSPVSISTPHSLVTGSEMDMLCGRDELGCSGMTSTGVDLTGWTWAKEQTVLDLANTLLPGPITSTPTTQDTSGWIDIFGITDIDEGIGFFIGHAATQQNPPILPILPTIFVLSNCQPTTVSSYCINDQTRLGRVHTTVRNSNEYSPDHLYTSSYLLFKDAAAVPVPGALLMFAPALFGLLGLRRKVRD